MVGSGSHPSVTGDIASRLAPWLVDRYAPQSILEIGCGKGYLIQALASYKSIEVVGIEKDKDLPVICDRRKVVRGGIKKAGKFRGFCLSVSFEVAEHVAREDQERFWESIFKASPVHVCSIHTALPEHKHHQTIRTAQEWLDWFRDHGMRARELGELYSVVPSWECSAFFEVSKA